ncbi:MAG TPA: cbb3-type cytochrome c oxidase subunit I [Methylomirabilota bacterium]|jgi:cytochrome c oxidase subunit I+III|nr:cbb3-type cytochrome c oxidase subunit I [Methylomirabilota bacterium]
MTETEWLHRSWGSRPGLIGWLTEVDHKRIAIRYILTALGFFVLAGVLALLVRLQLAVPNNRLLGPATYNAVFTMHGTAMMFLFAVPVMQGMGLYLVPLMIGTRNVAFPRLNLFGYYTFLFGGCFLFASLLLRTAPQAGWFSYVPLASLRFAPEKGVDIWAQTITFTELAALVAAVEIAVTALKLRAPGMSLGRMPIVVWSMLVMSVMVILAMPAIMVASSLLAMDRLVSTHFFTLDLGGDVILWQHLFWFFGHPEVYIIFVPALGFVSQLVVTFTRRSIVGYRTIVASLIATGAIGFTLWAHHMFAAGLSHAQGVFFMAASMTIAIPTGLQIFCWLATMWAGRPVFRTPFLFVIAFFLTFVLGGLTGVVLASVPIDLQLHDTFFVVAHLHYVLIGGALFPLLGALWYWLPKMSGRRMPEPAGRASVALLVLGFHVTFFPMHVLGVQGMPRRVSTYAAETGWATLNLTATAGAFLLAAGLLVYGAAVAWGLRRGRLAGPDPWGADSLEWGTASPPPAFNHAPLPCVTSAYPRWSPPAPVVEGLRCDQRELLVTSAGAARPSHRTTLDGPAISPLLLGVATAATLVGVVFTPWAIVWGTPCCFAALTVWFWPWTRHL